LSITLIFPFGLVLDIALDAIGEPYFSSDYILHMSNNNNNNQNNLIPSDNLPRNTNNKDPARLIRYVVGNIAALAARIPGGRLSTGFNANGTNVLIDIASSEEKANYWIDQYNHYMQFGRLRGGQTGHGPFERDRGTNPFEAPSDEANWVDSNYSINTTENYNFN
jgi:hypothetical protein